MKIKNLSRVKKSISDVFDRIRSNPEMLLDIGNKTVELTVAFNRSGKSPSGKRHPSNSDAWEERKKRLSSVNKTDEFYSYGFSNVTFTGELLKSINVVKIDKSSGSVVIDATGDHSKYKSLTGKSIGKKIKNSTLVEYLSNIGRFVFGINKQIENNINRIVRSYVVKEIKKFNK